VRHGRKLGAQDVFFFRLVAALVQQMGDAYPELHSQQPIIERVLKQEEEQFVRTLDRGLALLEDELTALGDAKVVPGEVVFKLYDTYGFPADLTADVVRDRDYTIDEAGFQSEMEKQRERGKGASNFAVDYNKRLKIDHASQFTGYANLQVQEAITGLIKQDAEVETIQEGDEALVILANTPFYAESGGQLGDTGLLQYGDNIFAVTDTLKLGQAIAHKGYVERGQFSVADNVQAEVDSSRRLATAAHHSVTHLLHAALRQVLGDHVAQKGSQVGPERLRFDFSHFEPLTMATIRRVEALVNAEIRKNHPIHTNLMSVDEAKQSGAMALFGEKYDDEVRVVGMGEFSTELCGGTHANRTGDIGFFKIIAESGVAAGIRRIEAVAGQAAIDYMHQLGEQIDETASLVKGDQFSIAAKVRQVMDRTRSLERELEQLKAKLAAHAGANLLTQVVKVNGQQVLVAELEGVDPKSLRTTMDELKNRLQSGVLLLATVADNKVSLIAGVTNDLTSKVKAGELVNLVAQQVGGKGGGRADMAQAGGTEPQALPAALERVIPWLEERL
jgi:alanyl-tRNA synthetase